MTNLAAALRRVAGDLDSLHVGWAVVGALAVSAHTEPRFTRDIDLAIAIEDDAMAEKLVRELLARGYRLVANVEHEGTSRLATTRLDAPDGGHTPLIVDLLFASSGIEGEIVIGASPVEVLPGVIAPIANIGDLIAMKLLSRDDDDRPQDAIDLRQLARAASGADLERARWAIDRITERGFHRRRDLVAALNEFASRRG